MFGMTEDEVAIALWRMRHNLVAADEELKPFRRLESKRCDWLRFARQSLLISSVQAGRSMEVSRGALLRVENREQTGRVTIATMRETAEAIGCEVIYAIRPKHGLSFAEASWLRLADDVNAKAARRHSLPQMRSHMKLSIAFQLLEKEPNLTRMMVNRQWRRR